MSDASGSGVMDALRHDDLDIVGRLVAASNTTLLCGLSSGARCVYKPVAGERPLWDFPPGSLAGREVAAFVVSEAAGWSVVPPTVVRDGPYGPGMCQLWIDDAREQLVDVVPPGTVPEGWLSVLDGLDGRGEPVRLVHADDERLRRLALFDAVINNADRKGGHVLVRGDGTACGIDHGVSFHTDDKLRTVLWGWAESPIRDDELAELRTLRTALDEADDLAGCLTPEEVDATLVRLDALIASRCFPTAHGRLHPIPWPAF